MDNKAQLEKLLGRKVVLTMSSIRFEGKEKELIASYRLAGLPSCCGASTLYNLKLIIKSKDLAIEKIVIRIIEKWAGNSWSLIQATTRNPRKIKLFSESGWEMKAKFNGEKGMTYLFQKSVPRTRGHSDW